MHEINQALTLKPDRTHKRGEPQTKLSHEQRCKNETKR